MKREIPWLFLSVAALLFLGMGCGGEATKKETFTAESYGGQQVLVGKETGLMWQSYTEGNVVTYLAQKKSDVAAKYCDDLEWAGFLDWRLPTIDELRTIVEGYPDLEWGGRCQVTKRCLAYPCKDKGSDGENDFPCAHNENKMTGPGPKGCYWEEVWGDRFCGPHWSTSGVEGGNGERWVLSFSEPAILITVEQTGTAFPRCVRER
jgi:hypothetical protein